jgi:hypothetical protein
VRGGKRVFVVVVVVVVLKKKKEGESGVIELEEV